MTLDVLSSATRYEALNENGRRSAPVRTVTAKKKRIALGLRRQLDMVILVWARPGPRRPRPDVAEHRLLDRPGRLDPDVTLARRHSHERAQASAGLALRAARALPGAARSRGSGSWNAESNAGHQPDQPGRSAR